LRLVPRVAVVLGLFALALAPAAANADSLVYTKGGNVWVSHSDGSAARQVTSAPNNWAWPSTADDGTIFVAGGAQRVNADGSDSDGSTEIYRLDQTGKQIGPFVETPGSRSTPACPTYAPDSLRVSPNGQRVSYNLFFCNNRDSFWQPAGSGSFTKISEDYAADMWLDDGHILISHIGSTFGNAAFANYDVATGDGHGPSDDPYLPERQAVASRSGNRVAVYEDDFDLSGNVTQADIRLFATTANDVTQPVQKCTITIPAAGAAKFLAASPTFTPDGTRLAWVEADGVHSANTSNLDSCVSTSGSLLVPGGAYPFFGQADEANVTPPPPPPPHHSFALRSATKKAKLSSSGALSFTITAAESGTGTATGTISVPKSAKTIRFARRKVTLVAGKPVKVTLKLSKKNAKLVRKALRHKRLKAKVTLTATAPSGDSATQKLAIALKR
jgi:hypothetical protein